jgi:hypothetical protein
MLTKRLQLGIFGADISQISRSADDYAARA